MRAARPIQHVVIIVKENHGYDNYFGKFPSGDGVDLPASPNPPPKDPDHRHAAWLKRHATAPKVAFPPQDIPHYWSYAQHYTLCDNYFTDVAGPSTPNHLMLIMADSALIDNPKTNYRLSPGPPLYDQPSLPAQLVRGGRGQRVQHRQPARAPGAIRIRHDRVEDLALDVAVVTAEIHARRSAIES